MTENTSTTGNPIPDERSQHSGIVLKADDRRSFFRKLSLASLGIVASASTIFGTKPAYATGRPYHPYKMLSIEEKTQSFMCV